jgi:YidC/Oxa1 family membrane protein insertase
LAIGTAIITPLYFVTSTILMGWHWLFDSFLNHTGAIWTLSIVGLTVTIRALLIPLFVRQIKASRNMQLLQPRVKELQKKYGHDRERLGQETMKLYKDSGTNPFASCMPLLLQAPIFLALFRLLDNASNRDPKGILTLKDAESIAEAKIFGAQIADTFIEWWRGDADGNVGILTTVLVLAMVATTFITQRQLMRKNMPESALTGQYAQQQKILLYVLPVVFAVGGIAFPVGVILYWTTSNLWTMGQQFYVIRNNPAPGTPAFEAKQERDRKHGKTVAIDPTKELGTTDTVVEKPRQQPKRQPRSQRRPGPATPRPPGSSSSSGSSIRRPVSGDGEQSHPPAAESGAQVPAPKKPPHRPNANKSRKKRRK